MSGTVNIARSLFSDEAFKTQPFTEREAFMWLVMEASWKDRTKRVGTITVQLKRGQLAASVRFMAEAWQWEKSTVDRFLKRLQKRDMIGTDCGTGVNVITVCKYNDYQGSGASCGTEENEKRDSSGTASGQTRTPDAIPDAIHKEPPLPPKGGERAILCEVMSERSADDFIAHRKAKRAKLTERAAQIIADNLRGHHDPDAVVRMSVMNGWTGIFPDRAPKPPPPTARLYDLTKYTG
jgi:hypothetical protein